MRIGPMDLTSYLTDDGLAFRATLRVNGVAVANAYEKGGYDVQTTK